MRFQGEWSGISEPNMPSPRRTGRVGVDRPHSTSASQRLSGGRVLRGGATSHRVPRGDQARSTSRRIAASGRDTRSTRTRPAVDPDAEKKTTLAAIGGAVGAVLVLIVGIALYSGSGSSRKPIKKSAPVQKLTASGHAERAAILGRDGIRKGKDAVARYERIRNAMTSGQRSDVVDLLTEADTDLDMSLAHLEKSIDLGGPDFNPGVNEKKFIEMRKVVRDLLKELQQ
jgi:hypothetical protein